MKTNSTMIEGLETERLILRKPEPSDALAITNFIGAKEVATMLATAPYPYRLEHAREWLDERQKNPDDQKGFVITLKDSGELIGMIGLHPKPDGLRAEMGFWIGVPFWGQGYCPEAAVEMLRFGFEECGYERIQAGHFPENHASGRVQQKIGLRYEGVQRWGGSRFGEMKDLVIRAIIRPDWERRQGSGG